MEVFKEDIQHFVPILLFGVILNRENYRVMALIVLAEPIYLFNGLLEIYRLAQTLVFDCMSYDWHSPVVVHIDLYALNPPGQIL